MFQKLTKFTFTLTLSVSRLDSSGIDLLTPMLCKSSLKFGSCVSRSSASCGTQPRFDSTGTDSTTPMLCEIRMFIFCRTSLQCSGNCAWRSSWNCSGAKPQSSCHSSSQFACCVSRSSASCGTQPKSSRHSWLTGVSKQRRFPLFLLVPGLCFASRLKRSLFTPKYALYFRLPSHSAQLFPVYCFQYPRFVYIRLQCVGSTFYKAESILVQSQVSFPTADKLYL